VATTKKRTTKATAKPVSRADGRAASRGIGPIKSKARRDAIEALIERTTKDMGLSPEVKARLEDDAWGKRLVDP
jgi:glycerophosphoryl diester phosphodiesterase